MSTHGIKVRQSPGLKQASDQWLGDEPIAVGTELDGWCAIRSYLLDGESLFYPWPIEPLAEIPLFEGTREALSKLSIRPEE